MKKNMFNLIKKYTVKDDADEHFFRLLSLLIGIFVIASVINPSRFLTAGNFFSQSRQFPEYGLLAIAISLTLLIGGIDISVVSIANISAIISAKFMLTAIPIDVTSEGALGYFIIAILISLTVGIIAGSINGFLISKIGITPILATLGTQQLFMGLSIVITKGNPLSGLPEILTQIINYSIGDRIPIVLIIFFICAIIVNFILSKTKTGARIYLLGGNPTAAKYAGINNDRIILLVYAMSGLLAAVAGIIMMGRTNSVKADYGIVYTLQAVLIAVLGGVSPMGGKGKIKGVVIAIILVQILSSIINMYSNISNLYRDLLWGGLLLIVLIFNYLMLKRSQSRIKKI